MEKREYARGAREALAWALMLLSNVKDMEQLQKVIDQIHDALQKTIKTGKWKKPKKP